ncbi:hypothetical protein SCP_1003100 [Sparassis crispa]|uniref:Fungal mating-type pheromone n=1 Tax=Sparassis crispa TaxID=139825 RepID=A0A401GXY5_9APHY|nr:hypothetical protein SCP_1003100 [Sparassis crispa]GBE87063.1 hypothetical protein SCP_1003100 [Sparassis crispa]
MDALFTIAAPVPAEEVETSVTAPMDFDTSGSGSGVNGGNGWSTSGGCIIA